MAFDFNSHLAARELLAGDPVLDAIHKHNADRVALEAASATAEKNLIETIKRLDAAKAEYSEVEAIAVATKLALNKHKGII